VGPVSAVDLERIEALVDRLGWTRARPLFISVASIDRRDRVRFVTHREAQTLKIALAVAAGDGRHVMV
jgi:hypothetical protein